ncbi:hypothetical protein L1887_26453 [Cichorium endivia]|nr:hypothetical protein L1887_26453 [Cichorium endivia]
MLPFTVVAFLYNAYRNCNTSAQSFLFYTSPVPFSTSAFSPPTPQLCHHDPRHRRTPALPLANTGSTFLVVTLTRSVPSPVMSSLEPVF